MARKLIALLVAAMMVLALVPAAAFAKAAPEQELRLQPVEKADNAAARGLQEAEPVKDDEALITWDFEEDPTTSGWNFIDADNDGKNWTWTTETTANSGTHTIKSASYESGALTPDNWAQSPYFDMPEGGATLSFWVKNYNASYPEVFEVWYGFEGGPGMNPVATNLSVTGSAWTQVSYQIPDSEGARGMIAIRHYGCTDMWKFYVDDVEISAPADPYEITTVEVDGFPTKIYNGQTPDDVLANITIPDNAHYMITEISAYDVETESQLDGGDQFEEGKSYLLGVSVETDLDYYFAEDAELLANGGALELDIGYSSVTTYIAFVVPVEYVCGGDAPLYGWYFETEDELEGWGLIDNDGDDSNWYWLNNNSFGADNYDQYAYEGEGFMGSPSWNNVALTPDNYLLTPELEIPEGTTTLSFYAAGLGANYCQEHFAVYAVPEGASTVDEFTEILPETVATAGYVNYTVDLSDYAGQSISIAFRHFNCTDMNWFRLDQVEIFNEGGEEPELIPIHEVYVNGYESPVAGENAEDHLNLTVPDDAHYSIRAEGVGQPVWWDEDAEHPFFDSFVEGTNYSVGVTLDADEGYYFADDCVFYVNDDENLVNPAYTGVNEDDNTLCSVWTAPEPATSGEEPPAPGEPVLGYYFESDDEIADFIFLDVDGDSYSWSRNTQSSYAYEGTGSMGSHYNYTTNVDNWMIMPEFHVPETDPSMTLYARERTTTYGAECFSVFVGTDPNDLTTFIQVGTTIEVDFVEYQQFEFDLSAYAGMNVYVAIRHFDCSNTYYLYIDQVEFWGEYGEQPPEPVIIDEIEINDFEIPVYGANPDFDFTVPEGAHYFIADVGWTVYDPETGDTAMAPGDVFDNPNATYYAVIILGCEEGYDFPDEAIVMINGETALVDFSFGYEGEYYIATVDFTVEEPVIGILGDVDLDGTVEVEDAILALRYAMGIQELTDEQLAQADVDGDGDYDLVDATLILRYAMGLIDEFPIPAEPILPEE